MSVRAIRRDPDTAPVVEIHDNREVISDGSPLVYLVGIDATPMFKCDTFAEARRVKLLLELVSKIASDLPS